jgi:undecaprenyl-diphosphatase
MVKPAGASRGRADHLTPARSALGCRSLRDLDTLDRSLYKTIATVQTPSLDLALARVSSAANHSKLWLAFAGALATVGGDRGRRAALLGVASVGVTSMVNNTLVKWMLRRRRPDRIGAEVPLERWVPMPRSRSFPSGHSASAFAFAAAVGSAIPPLSLPLHLSAAIVAYSRVHTGVHYPGDTIAGALIGTATATTVGRATRLWAGNGHPRSEEQKVDDRSFDAAGWCTSVG